MEFKRKVVTSLTDLNWFVKNMYVPFTPDVIPQYHVHVSIYSDGDRKVTNTGIWTTRLSDCHFLGPNFPSLLSSFPRLAKAFRC